MTVSASAQSTRTHFSCWTVPRRPTAASYNPAVANRTSTAQLREGAAVAWPVGVGLVPIGLGFGIVMVGAGFAWWWTPVFSVVIYAGSMEFLAVALLTGGASLLVSAATALAVNFRHVFYGLSFPLSTIRRPLGRAYGIYALTDESYAIASTRARTWWTGPRILTVQALCQLLWVGSGIVGALMAEAISVDLSGAQFALTALFAALAVEAYKVSRDASSAFLGALCAVVALLVTPGAMLVVGLTVLVCLLLVRYRVRASSRRETS